jgi:hypothetical protein
MSTFKIMRDYLPQNRNPVRSHHEVIELSIKKSRREHYVPKFYLDFLVKRFSGLTN